jgi:hypothetical protein
MTTTARLMSAVLAVGVLAGGAAAPRFTQPVDAPPCTRFVTPGTAGAGEWIPVLAYRHRDRRGPLEIRFDGQPVAYRLLRYAAFSTPQTELFLSVHVPSGVPRGLHDLELYEPSPTPGRAPERLAVSAIVLGP